MSTYNPSSDFDFATPLAISGSVICPWFFVLYFVNRHVYPIAQREPVSTLIANVSFWLAAQIWLLELYHYAIPCIVDTFAVLMLVGITIVFISIKVWKIYMDAGLTNELETEKYGWFVAHRNWRSRRSLNIIAACMMGVHFVMFIVAVVSDAEHAFKRGNTCDNTISALIMGGLALLYLIVFVAASFKLAKVKDNYFIKSELRMMGLGSGLLALGYLMNVGAQLPCVLPECTTMLLWFCWLACFLASTIYPLTKAMWDQKFLWWWDLCRRKALEHAKQRLCNSRLDGDISYVDSMASRTESSFAENDPSIAEVKNPISERNPMRVLSSHLNPRDPALARLKKMPLSRVLSFGPGKEAFRRFAVLEFSVENLLFVEAVSKFRALEDPTKRDVQDVYDKFVSNSAPSQVNLPMKIVRKMTEKLPTIDGVEIRAFFDESVDHVMKMMQRDSYRRFQDTMEFAVLAVEIEGVRLSVSQQAPPTALPPPENVDIEVIPAPPLPAASEPRPLFPLHDSPTNSPRANVQTIADDRCSSTEKRSDETFSSAYSSSEILATTGLATSVAMPSETIAITNSLQTSGSRRNSAAPRASSSEKPFTADATRRGSLNRVCSDSGVESSSEAPLREFSPEFLSFNSSDSVAASLRSSSEFGGYQLL